MAQRLISIVDDDEDVRRSLGNLIRSFQLPTRDFSSSEAFLESDHMHDTSCLILDVRMPGMTGLDLQRRIRANHRPIPIIFVTSHADETARVRALDAGAIAFLSKPVHVEELLKAIDAAFTDACIRCCRNV
jgi:FixJ family two-component response regulator